MKTHLYTCVTIISFLLTTILSQVTIAQPVFEQINNLSQSLTTAEQQLVSTVESRSTTNKLLLLRVSNLKQLENSHNISLPINSTTFYFEQNRIRHEGKGRFTWSGKSNGQHREIYLFYHEEYLHGNIHWDSLAYNIEPVNKDIVIITELDPASFDTCSLEDEHDSKKSKQENQRQDNKSKSPTGNSAMMLSNPEIDILVVYTPQAASESGNIGSLINAAIQSTNETLTNSGVNATVNLVHSAQVSYNESGNMNTDLSYLHNPSDGYMDDVHNWRYQYGADIVVLLTSTGQYCGIAYWIEVPSEDAFAISRNDCSVGNYTFAHEIGHLIGGRHDTDGSSSPRPYAHGYTYAPAYWRTVMAVDGTANRIPYWSNPNKTYGGIPMGTTSWNDNVRVWNERATTVADFDGDLTPPPPPPPSVSISGPTQIDQGTYHTWNANVSDGTPPFSYSWYKNTSGSWNYVGSGSSYYGSSTTTFSLKVEVTDDNSTSDDAVISVLVSDPGGCQICKIVGLPEEFTLQHNYPNPFNPSTQIEYALPEESEVSIRVFNIMGQQVATLLNETRSAGFHQVHFEAGNLSSGIYIARMEAVGESGQQFTHELKMQLIK